MNNLWKSNSHIAMWWVQWKKKTNVDLCAIMTNNYINIEYLNILALIF